MKPESLIDGVHMTQAEINYVMKIVGIIGQAGYHGPIDIRDSRSRGNYVSKNKVRFALSDNQLGLFDLDKIHALLNKLAKQNNLSCARMVELKNYIIGQVRPQVLSLFEYPNIVNFDIGSDVDIHLKKRPTGVQAMYRDEVTGIHVHVWDGKKWY